MPNRRKAIIYFIYTVFLCTVFISRYSGISLRPMHCDEANQAYKTGILLEKGIYKYDPHEHHGPLLYYSTLPILYLYKVHQFQDTTEEMFRLVPLIFSLFVFLSFLPIKKYVGLPAFIVSSLFLAVSHAFFFYSRYYIHETLFVLFSSLFILSVWEYILQPHLLFVVFSGITLSLAFASKETSIIVLFSTLLASILTKAYLFKTSQFIESNSTCPFITSSWGKTFIHLCIFAISFFIPWVLLFSSFFTNKGGLLDFFRAYQTYLFRASGEGSSGIHDKPWWYYIQIITYFNKTVGPVWSEGIIILFCILGLVTSIHYIIKILFTKKCSPQEQRLSAFYIFLFTSYFTTFFIFCVIPYKTPWNILFPLLGMILFGGIGFQTLWEKLNKRWSRLILVILLSLGLYHLAYLTYEGNFIYYADISNPYVYAHTSTSLVKMMNRIYQLSEILTKENRETVVFVIDPTHDYWPIPWYLRKIHKKGFWATIPEETPIDTIPFIIISPGLSEELENKLKGKQYMKEVYTIRPGVFRYLYIDQSVWDKFIEIQSTPKT